MSEFSSEVSLLARPDEASIREAERVIEDRLSETVTVAAEPAVADGGGATGGGPAGRPEAMTRELRDQSDQLAEAIAQDQRRNLLLEELLEALGSGGGGGGGGGGGFWEDLFGPIGEGLGDAVGGAALTTAASALSSSAAALTGAAGALTGAAAADAVDDLFGDDVSGSVTVEKPEWAPIGVDAPRAIPAVAVESPIPIEDPGTLSVEDPELDEPLPLPVEDLTVDVDGLPGPLPGPFPRPQPAPPESDEAGFFDTIDKRAAQSRDLVPRYAPPGSKTLSTVLGGFAGGIEGGADVVTDALDDDGGGRARRPGGGGSGGGGVSVFNDIDLDVTIDEGDAAGLTESEATRLVESKLDEFKRSLEREFSRRGR